MILSTYKQMYEGEVIQLWNKTLFADTITVDKFRKQALFDDNFDESLCCVALEEERVVGFILAMKRKFPYLERGLEPKRGWINVIIVDEEYQRHGIGTAMMEKMETALKNMGAEDITIAAYSPNYFFAGVDAQNYVGASAFFSKLNYQVGEESYSMSKDIHGFQLPITTKKKLEQAIQEGFKFQGFDYKYALALLEFAKVEFGGGWKRNLLMSMREDEAKDCVLIVLDKHEEIVGFCMRKIDGNPMRFGPIGVKEDVRNYGIGGILFDLMQLEMSKKGIYHLYFVSTDKPGRRFYERHDVHVFRTFLAYRKNIEGGTNE